MGARSAKALVQVDYETPPRRSARTYGFGGHHWIGQLRDKKGVCRDGRESGGRRCGPNLKKEVRMPHRKPPSPLTIASAVLRAISATKPPFSPDGLPFGARLSSPMGEREGTELR